jgi:hypothetical protein
MADTVTVASVITGARSRIDDAGGAVSDGTDILIYVRQAWKDLHALYLGAEPDRFRTEATITTTGAATYALPATWFSTICVDYQQSSTERSPLHRLQEDDRNLYYGVTGERAQAFRVIGTNVVLYPTPPTGQTYVHAYLPVAPTIASDATELDVRLGHDHYLQKVVARELLRKEDAYDGRFEKDIEKLEAELTEAAALRYLRDSALMSSERVRDRFRDPADYRWWSR